MRIVFLLLALSSLLFGETKIKCNDAELQKLVEGKIAMAFLTDSASNLIIRETSNTIKLDTSYTKCYGGHNDYKDIECNSFGYNYNDSYNPFVLIKAGGVKGLDYKRMSLKNENDDSFLIKEYVSLLAEFDSKVTKLMNDFIQKKCEIEEEEEKKEDKQEIDYIEHFRGWYFDKDESLPN